MLLLVAYFIVLKMKRKNCEGKTKTDNKNYLTIIGNPIHPCTVLAKQVL